MVNGSVGRITWGCVVGVSVVAGVLYRSVLCLSGGRLAAGPISFGLILKIYIFFFGISDC